MLPNSIDSLLILKDIGLYIIIAEICDNLLTFIKKNKVIIKLLSITFLIKKDIIYNTIYKYL